MNKKLGVAVVLAAVMVSTTTTVRAAVSTDLPSGADLSVSIANPLEGAVVVSGTPVTVSGSASVGEAPALKNTDLVFVIDTSGSTGSASGISCGSVLQCEKAAVLQLVSQANAARSPIGNVGMAAFPDTNVLALVAPSSPTIPTYVNGLTAAGGTDYSAGISHARPILGASAADEKLLVLVTDGEGTLAPSEAPVGAVVLAFTIGGQACTATVQQVVALGLPGGSCSQVNDLGQLAGVIQETIGSSLDSIAVTVDGNQVFSSAPHVTGPGSATFSTPAGALANGAHTICATANGSDASGTGSATECVHITVVPPGSAVVNCGAVSGDCTANAQDPGKSTLKFSAPPVFDETVTIIPNSGAANACGGSTCRTGYDVLFPTTSATGPVVSLTVVSTKKLTLLERLQAAVYIDNVRITAQCSNRIIIKLIRDALGRPEPIPCITIQYLPSGQVEYFVKFRADPGVRFR
jgi:Mg-chelatase subunit ChlD